MQNTKLGHHVFKPNLKLAKSRVPFHLIPGSKQKPSWNSPGPTSYAHPTVDLGGTLHELGRNSMTSGGLVCLEVQTCWFARPTGSGNGPCHWGTKDLVALDGQSSGRTIL